MGVENGESLEQSHKGFIIEAETIEKQELR